MHGRIQDQNKDSELSHTGKVFTVDLSQHRGCASACPVDTSGFNIKSSGQVHLAYEQETRHGASSSHGEPQCLQIAEEIVREDFAFAP